MANNNKYGHSLLDLDNRISKEIELAGRELSNLEVKNTDKYKEFNQHRINHIQDLFDEASDIIRELDITKLTGDIPAILQAKKNIQSNFGAFQEVQRIWNDIINEKDKDKDEYVLERTMPVPNVIIEEPIPEEEVIPDFFEEPDFDEFDEEAIQAEQEALAAIEKKAEEKEKKEKARRERKQQEKYRQEREAREAYIREQDRNREINQQAIDNSKNTYEENQRYIEQHRQDEAVRLGMRVDGNKSFSEADIEREKFRQHEAEEEARNKAEEVRRRDREVFESYRKKEEAVLNYESFGTGHIDFSAEFQKERNLQREAERALASENEYISYSYAPSGDKDNQYSVHQNRINYDKDIGYQVYYQQKYNNYDYNEPVQTIPSPVDITSQRQEYTESFDTPSYDRDNRYTQPDDKKYSDTYTVPPYTSRFQNEQRRDKYGSREQQGYQTQTYPSYQDESKPEYENKHETSHYHSPEDSRYSEQQRRDYVTPGYVPPFNREGKRPEVSLQYRTDVQYDRSKDTEFKSGQVSHVEKYNSYKTDGYDPSTPSRDSGSNHIKTGTEQEAWDYFYNKAPGSRQTKIDSEQREQFSEVKDLNAESSADNRYSQWKKPVEQEAVKRSEHIEDSYPRRGNKSDNIDRSQYNSNTNNIQKNAQQEEKKVETIVSPRSDETVHKREESSYPRQENPFGQKNERPRTGHNETVKTDNIGHSESKTNIYGLTGLSDNKHIYESIENQAKSARANGSTEIPVISAVYTDMLRRNVETAHEHWKDARGTPEERKAIQEYREQRKVLDKVKNDIQNKAYRIEKPKQQIPDQQTGTNEKKADTSGKQQQGESTPRFSNYRPGRVITEPSTGEGTTGKYSRRDRSIPRDNFRYTKENPLRVSKEYKEAIYRKAASAQESLNYLVDKGRIDKKGPVKISPKNAADLQMSLDALAAFKKAEEAGVVVVTDESRKKNPDYQMWQQRKYTNYSSGTKSKENNKGAGPGSPPPGGGPGGGSPPEEPTKSKGGKGKGEGTQGAFKFFNRNKSNIQDTDILKYKRLTNQYLRNVASRTEMYVHRAGGIVGRNIYSIMQSGEDNALNTFESGRYYITTGVQTANVLRHLHIVNAGKIEKSALRLENVKFNKFSVASNEELKVDIAFKTRARDLKKEATEKLLSKGNLQAILLKDPEAIENSKQLLKEIYGNSILSGGLKSELNFQAKQEISAIELKMAKELEDAKRLRVTAKQVNAKQEELKSKHWEKVKKKFGIIGSDDLEKTGKEFAKAIEDLKLEQIALKGKIKNLESLGSKLTAAQRKELLSLKNKHKANGEKLRKMFGLQKERAIFNSKMDYLDRVSSQIASNFRAIANSLRVLGNYVVKPFREGDVLAANGFYYAGSFVANRHTRSLITKSIKASRWVARHGVDAGLWITGNDPILLHNAEFAVKAKVGATKIHAKNTAQAVVSEAKGRVIKTARDTGKVIVDHTPEKIRTAVRSTKDGASKTKRAVDKIWGSIKDRYQRSFVARGINSMRVMTGESLEKAKRIASIAKALLGKVALYAIGIFLFLVLLISIFGLFMGSASSTSVVLSPYDGSDKINLKPYMEILNAEQLDFDTKLNNAVQSKTYRGKTYDKVFINYATSTRNNFKEIISMMAVRLQQDINIEENPEVRQYLKSLYNDSHKLAASESPPYSCAEGCETRTVTCNPGCEEYSYVCSWGPTDDCTNQNEHGYCGGHTARRCPGHEEKYCPGKHVDLTLTISVLSFDEIFGADTMGNAGSTGVAGGLIGYATVTYYCCEQYPHICNAGPPYKTATGTTPTPGRTIAVDPNKIPLGTHVIIDGHEYIAEDTGGAIDNLDIDIVVATHDEAMAKGKRYNVPVYHVSYEGAGGPDANKWEGWTPDNIEWCKLIYSPNWGELYEGINDYDGNIEIGDLVVAGNWVWPVTATTASSGFGWRDNPTNPGNQEFHKGTDIPIPEGTPVHAAGDGTVTSAHFSSTAGNMVIIQHANGVLTKYFHNSRLLVSAGDTVTAGQVIALSGNTGNSTGPHLHFEFWVNGRVVDPRLQYGL